MYAMCDNGFGGVGMRIEEFVQPLCAVILVIIACNDNRIGKARKRRHNFEIGKGAVFVPKHLEPELLQLENLLGQLLAPKFSKRKIENDAMRQGFLQKQ